MSVGVVITTYNHAHFLEEALASVFRQRPVPDAVVVVDDGSSDDPAAVVARFPGTRFVTLERLPWHDLRAAMAEADVVVDQLFMGWYGMVAVEAMALGKPVLCYIRPDFEARLEGCPIVRTSLETLAEDLAHVLSDATDRRLLGEAGRAYVEREHAAPVLAQRLLRLYESIRGARAHA